jgi:hypothetical protein
MANAKMTLYLHTAGNTASPCLQAIVSKGYTVTHFFQAFGGEPQGQGRPVWAAEKDSRMFSAERLEEVLGLIAMWEIRGDDWYLQDGEAALYEQLVRAAPNTTPRQTG